MTKSLNSLASERWHFNPSVLNSRQSHSIVHLLLLLLLQRRIFFLTFFSEKNWIPGNGTTVFNTEMEQPDFDRSFVKIKFFRWRSMWNWMTYDQDRNWLLECKFVWLGTNLKKLTKYVSKSCCRLKLFYLVMIKSESSFNSRLCFVEHQVGTPRSQNDRSHIKNND